MRTDGGLARWVAPGVGRERFAKRSPANSYAGVMPKFAGAESTIEINVRVLRTNSREALRRLPSRLSILRVA